MKLSFRNIIAWLFVGGLLAVLVACETAQTKNVRQVSIQAAQVSVEAKEIIFKASQVSLATTQSITFFVASPASSPPPGMFPIILKHPKSQDAQVGTSVNLQVVAVPPPPFTEDTNTFLSYQWKINGFDLPAATNYNYSITNVQFSDAANYTVVVKGGESLGYTETNSLPAHLTVYEYNILAGNGGTAATPIGEFTSSGSCQSVVFDKYVVKVPFDGPSITPPLVRSANWPNPSNLPKLTVDTFDSRNGTTLDTAVQTAQNWGFLTTLCCNNNTTPPPPLTNPNLSKCTITMLANKQYRTGIFYKSATLPGGTTNIWWRWNYHM